MVQVAHSGKQKILEGSQTPGTSKKLEGKPMYVARAAAVENSQTRCQGEAMLPKERKNGNKVYAKPPRICHAAVMRLNPFVIY